GGDNEFVPALLEEFPEPELARHAPEKLTGREVDRLGSRRGLPVVVALYLRDVVSRVCRRIPVDGILVENAEDVRHIFHPSLELRLGHSRCSSISCSEKRYPCHRVAAAAVSH